MPNAQPEWRQFSIPRVFASPLSTVSHVAHVHTALEILAAGRLRPGLVFDKSRLNSSRVLVTWLSPNDWTGAGGFRYGNVSFSFDWKSLIRGRRFYWVESIAYKTPACRILITDNDYSGALEEYDPRHGDGPWSYDPDEDAHYWNGGYCLELMLEDSIYLHNVFEVTFVKHHPNLCSINRSTCRFLGEHAGPASGLFLAGLVSSSLDPTPLHLTSRDAGQTTPTQALQFAFAWLRGQILNIAGRPRGTLTLRHAAAFPVMRGILSALYNRNESDVHHLAALYASVDDLNACCAKVVAEHFEIPNRNQLEPT